MIYEIFIKDCNACPAIFHTRDMEIARAIIKDRFFSKLNNITDAIDVSLDATETDQEKTGIIMQFRIKYKMEGCSGSVTAIPESGYFLESYKPEVPTPKVYNVNFI